MPIAFGRGAWLAWLVFALALAFTLASWRHAEDSAEREAQLRFDAAALDMLFAIDSRMAAYRQILRGGVALFAASESVTRSDWRRYLEAARIAQSFPGIQGVSFVPVVSGPERDAHIRAVRAEGHKEYTIRPEGERTEYAPVVYIEPFAGLNLRAFGYDVYSDPVRRAAMERARDTAEAAITGKVTLVQEQAAGTQAGFLMSLAVYRNGAPPASVAERRAALVGYVNAPFRMKELMHDILGRHTTPIDLKIYDAADLSPAALLYDNVFHAPATPRFMRALPLEIAGRTWTLRFASSPEFEAMVATRQPQVILVGGIALSALVFLLTLSFLGLRHRSAILLARDAELQRTRDRLDFLLAHTPAVIYAAKLDGSGATFISENVRALLGHEPQAYTVPGFWASHIHPQDRERVLARFSMLEKAGADACEYRFQAKDGAWCWMHDAVTLVRDAAGAPAELVGYWIDVSARKQTEEVRSQLLAILDATPDFVGIADAKDTHVLYINPAGRRMIGIGREDDVTRLKIADVHPGWVDALFRGEIIPTAIRDGLWIGEVAFLNRDGGEVPVLMVLLAHKASDGTVLRFSTVSRDIAEIKQARIALEQSDRMKSEFMAAVTHELRTPLNSVLGFAGLLKDEVPGPLNAKQAAFVSDIIVGGQDLLRLVEGMLEMSRLGAAEARNAGEAVDVGVMLRELVDARHKRGRVGVELTLDVAPDLGLPHLDPKALRRTLDVLLDNAIKFNREGGTVTVRARRTGNWLEIAVTDSGIGIAREDLAKLFQPFVQLDAGLARRYGGMGLGLTIAQRLAAAQGGSIEVQSEPGKGSTFTLRLPIVETPS